MRRAALRVKLLFLAGATVFALAAGEALCRVALVRRHHAAVAAWDGRLYRIDEELELAYRLQPGAERENPMRQGEGTWTYAINAAGLRDEPLAERGEQRRIVALGDSYTFGWGVDQGDDYPAQLERALRAGGWPVEVLNTGVPGYNTLQELWYLKHDVLALEPDLVVLGFVMNDGEPQLNVPAHPAVTYSNVRLWSLELAKGPLNRLFGANEEEPLFAPEVHAASFDYVEGFRAGVRKGAESLAALAEIAATCRAAGVDLVCFVLPDFTSKFDPGYRNMRIHWLVRQACADAGVLCHDLLPTFQGRDHRHLQVAGDGHPNAEGLGMIAAAMAIAIRRDFPWLARPR